MAAAVAVLRAEGLRKVTMRRLAEELDTGPASLYVYVRNTAELHAADTRGAPGRGRPGPRRGPLARAAGAVLTSYTAMLFEYPGLAHSALAPGPAARTT